MTEEQKRSIAEDAKRLWHNPTLQAWFTSREERIYKEWRSLAPEDPRLHSLKYELEALKNMASDLESQINTGRLAEQAIARRQAELEV